MNLPLNNLGFSFVTLICEISGPGFFEFERQPKGDVLCLSLQPQCFRRPVRTIQNNWVRPCIGISESSFLERHATRPWCSLRASNIRGGQMKQGVAQQSHVTSYYSSQSLEERANARTAAKPIPFEKKVSSPRQHSDANDSRPLVRL